ncbi:MAG: YciI family protein [Novosphingobium sp.]
MPLYAAICLDHPPHSGDKRDEFRQPHREYVQANDAPIRLVGPLLDDDGNQCASIYIFEAECAQDVTDWLAGEPFTANGVYRDVIVQEFFLGKNSLPAQDWPNRTT